MYNKPLAVVTTIQHPTYSMINLRKKLIENEWDFLVIGDKKGPLKYELEGTQLITLEQQLKLPFKLAPLLPVNHYARKNLGYLVGMSRNAPCIYETDDDNVPLPHWKPRKLKVSVKIVRGDGNWYNAYQWFTRENIWPRGFPLTMLKNTNIIAGNDKFRKIEAPIQQGIANGSPDVDAIWRLIFNSNIEFNKEDSIALPEGIWCPFNSQSTWWWPKAFPLMYLPSFCSFRMTDIWRSYIAQRCLWALGEKLVFHSAEVFQKRNEHNLIVDFEDEIPGYLSNEKLCDLLMSIELKRGFNSVTDNLLKCYECLINQNIFKQQEMKLVTAWVKDINRFFYNL